MSSSPDSAQGEILLRICLNLVQERLDGGVCKLWGESSRARSEVKAMMRGEGLRAPAAARHCCDHVAEGADSWSLLESIAAALRRYGMRHKSDARDGSWVKIASQQAWC
jgi:hypothetical protein